MWGQSKTGSASQIFPSHLYSRANEAGNIGNVEIKYEKILGCVKEKRIMCKVIAVSSSGVLANYIFAVISHLRASFPAVLLLSVRLMAGHIKETFILLFTMAGACLIVFLVPGLFVLFPGILCGIASHLIEPGLKKALAID